MSDEEQDILISLTRQREKRRDEIGLNIIYANEDYSEDRVFGWTVDEIMAELKK